MKAIEKILCVIDPTEDEQPAMHRAAWLARHTGAELELFVAYYNEYLGDEWLISVDVFHSDREQWLFMIDDDLDELAKPLRKDGLAVTTKVVWERVLHEGIVRRAVEIGADIVFKDTHYHPAISRALHTSTDWNLIRTCPMPLWLVRGGDTIEKPRYLLAVDPLHEHAKPEALDERIIEVAKTLSEKTGGEIHAFHGYNPLLKVADTAKWAVAPSRLPVEELDERMRDAHKEAFEALLEAHGLDLKNAHLQAGRTHELLPALALRLKADVVVMGAVGRGRLGRLFLGATAEKVMDHLPCDLVVVKPEDFETPVE